MALNNIFLFYLILMKIKVGYKKKREIFKTLIKIKGI